VEYITDTGLLMEQPENAYHFSGDAVALGEFAACKKTDIIIDIGCGTGILTLLLAAKSPRKIIAVDINKDATEQIEKNIVLNKMKLKTDISVHNTDAKVLHKTIGANTADIIVCNPPYFGSGKKPTNPNKNFARHDSTLSLRDLASAATKILKYGGVIYFCYPANKTAKAITVFENNNFRVKEIKFISNNKGIYLALFKCKKGGGDSTKIYAPLPVKK
jgi:tRNA1(Val) A37 N6-methylase TrmN6